MLLNLLLLFGLHETELAVYPYGSKLELRDQLIGSEQMYDDLGGYLIGEANLVLAKELQVDLTVLPPVPSQHQAVILTNHAHDSPAYPANHQGIQLWQSPDKNLTIKAVPDSLLTDLHEKPFSCHGAFRLVSQKNPLALANFQNRQLSSIWPDPDIEALVAQVSKANLLAGVNTLVGFGTRRHFQPGEIAAQNWIRQELQALGYQTSLFNYDSGGDVVIGDFPGVTQPEKVVILGAHYDSYNYSTTTGNAPGADDDASGVSAILEIARLLAGHQFDYTLRFCAFSGEEFGLLGSEAYAAHLDSQGADVVAMIQLDMIAYRANGDSRSVDFVTNDTTPSLNNFAMEVYRAYVPTLLVQSGYLSGGTSDHSSFFRHGFAACFPFEDLGQYSPYIHTSSDTVGLSANDFDLATLHTQGALATMAEVARPAGVLMEHIPLSDTRNELGPYFVVVDAPDRNGHSIAQMTLHHKVDQGAWIDSPFQDTLGAGQWHAQIPGQVSGTSLNYWVEALDDRGRTLWLPESLPPGSISFSFRVGTAAVIYRNEFEGSSDEGWTHVQVATQDDWQRGIPFGQAGDPSAAYSGTQIWGNDLGPSGWNGEYQANVHNRLKSPAIDCTGQSGVRLRFQRWLTVEEGQYDQAFIKVNGTKVWENPVSGNTFDASWVPIDIDISALADDDPSVIVRFELVSDGGVEYGGWNIDDFELVTVGPSDGTDWIFLVGPNDPQSGTTASWTVSGAPALVPCWVLWSRTDTGSSIHGHAFEVGAGWQIGASGQTNEIGQATFSAPIPASMQGVNIFLEAAAYDAATNTILDSAALAVSIQ